MIGEKLFFSWSLFLRLGDSCNSILDENGAWRILETREIYIGNYLLENKFDVECGSRV